MLEVQGFKFQVGDVIEPIDKKSFYMRKLIIDDIHLQEFAYTVVDLEGDTWKASPLLIENEFVLKGEH